MKLLTNRLLNLLVVLSLIFSTSANTDDSVFIEKNQPAPFSGVLFTEKKANELRRDLLELDKTSLKLESQTLKLGNLGQIIKLKNEEIELYQKQNNRLIDQSNTSENMKYIWFGLGVLMTGAAVYGAGSLAK